MHIQFSIIHIKGISINGLEYEISLMADDTTLFLSNLESLELVVKQFDLFSKCSGLNLNINKTEIVPLGTLTGDHLIFSKTMQGIKIHIGPHRHWGYGSLKMKMWKVTSISVSGSKIYNR